MNITSVSAIGAPPIATQLTRPTPPDSGQGGGFGDLVTKAIDALNESHAEADRLAVQAATGDLSAAHDYTIAATEAQLLTQLTVEVRNRAVEAFNDIMRMQV